MPLSMIFLHKWPSSSEALASIWMERSPRSGNMKDIWTLDVILYLSGVHLHLFLWVDLILLMTSLWWGAAAAAA
eukprot:6197716-Karenia_brevis.AAC.1